MPQKSYKIPHFVCKWFAIFIFFGMRIVSYYAEMILQETDLRFKIAIV